MILLDFSQIVVAGIFQNLNETGVVDESAFRHKVFNSVRKWSHKFKRKYGELVVCIDDRKNWRVDEFRYYKFRRKLKRSESDVDWDAAFKIINQLIEDLKEIGPYKCIKVDKAEADDIIGHLARQIGKFEPVMIVSSDGDFKQLQRYQFVEQFSPQTKKKVISKNPLRELREKVVRGDSGDDIPNIFSPQTAFKDGIRQTPVKTTLLEEQLEKNPKDAFTEEQLERFRQNRKLIDLTQTPEDIKMQIEEQFSIKPKGSKMKLMKYLAIHKLDVLAGCIEEF